MSARDFLGTVIASGLELEMLRPEDVIERVSMKVLAHHLPPELKSRLLTAALAASEMNATLVLDTLGIEGIVEHAPAPLLWQIVASGAERALGNAQPGNAQPGNAQPGTAQPGKASTEARADSATRLPPGPRKPNISARVSRIRAGATSRPTASTPHPDDDDLAFDVDTRVGAEEPASDFDAIDEAAALVGDDVTAHGNE